MAFTRYFICFAGGAAVGALANTNWAAFVAGLFVGAILVLIVEWLR